MRGECRNVGYEYGFLYVELILYDVAVIIAYVAVGLDIDLGKRLTVFDVCTVARASAEHDDVEDEFISSSSFLSIMDSHTVGKSHGCTLSGSILVHGADKILIDILGDERHHGAAAFASVTSEV